MTALHGVHEMTATDYHARSELSSSGAKLLLPPNCPALFRYAQDNQRPTKRTFEIGHAAHQQVLGVGPELVLVDADRWDTKVIKEELAAIREAGNVPLKAAEFEQVQAMARVLREHPYAGALFDPQRGGKAEQSLFWTDPETGVECRARLDWLPASTKGRMIVPDYKSAAAVDPEAIGKALDSYRYVMQAPWYLDAVLALGLAESAAFVFVSQMKTPPYLVTVNDVTAESLLAGRFYNRQARQLFAECTAADRWPGFSDDGPITVSLPGWALNRYYEESGL